MMKLSVGIVLVLSVAQMGYAGMSVGGFLTSQGAVDTDTGYGVGAEVKVGTDSLLPGTFLDGRISYLTGFADADDAEVSVVPLEIGAGYSIDLSGVNMYGAFMVGYYMTSLDEGDAAQSSGIIINGSPVDTGAQYSYDISDSVGFALLAGGEYFFSETISIMLELRYQVLTVDTEMEVSGGAPTQIGNILIVPANGTYDNEADLSGVGVTAGMRIRL